MNDADLEAAITAAEEEVGSGETVEETATEAPTEETVQETETPAEVEQEPEPAKEEDEEDEPLGLSAETLAKINSDPRLQEAYRSMQSGFTRKMQSLSARSEEETKLLGIANWIRANPEEAYKELGAELERRKGTPAPAAKPDTNATVDELAARWEKDLGPKAKEILLPVVQDTVRTIAEGMLRAEIEPLKQNMEANTRAAAERGLQSALNAYTARLTTDGKEWNDEISAQVAKVVEKIEPAQGTTLEEMLDSAYGAVMYARSQKAAKKAELSRLKKVRGSIEPNVHARPESNKPQRITRDMSEKDAIEMAVAMAERELA